jgi:cis-3-alkyl-4-acyloxetan-2-one decarboxylase
MGMTPFKSSTDPGNWQTLYPDCGREMTISGLRYHYLDNGSTGEDDDRPVVLCVHGNPTWSFYWRSVFEALGDSFRIIAVDHIGCGLSDKPSRSEFRYSLASHRDNLVTLIDRLDLRDVTLLAHDWGGAIGLAASIERVERMSAIMLLNTAAFPPPYVPWRIAACRTPILGTLALRGLNLFARAAVPMAMSRNRMSPAVARGLLYPYGNWHDRVGIDSFVRDIPFSGATRPTACCVNWKLTWSSFLICPSCWFGGCVTGAFAPNVSTDSCVIGPTPPPSGSPTRDITSSKTPHGKRSKRSLTSSAALRVNRLMADPMAGDTTTDGSALDALRRMLDESTGAIVQWPTEMRRRSVWPAFGKLEPPRSATCTRRRRSTIAGSKIFVRPPTGSPRS